MSDVNYNVPAVYTHYGLVYLFHLFIASQEVPHACIGSLEDTPCAA